MFKNTVNIENYKKNYKNVYYSREQIKSLMPKLNRNDNKYTRGKCSIVAGSNEYPGAALLAARACDRAGCGYTELFTSKDNVKNCALLLQSCPVRPFEQLMNCIGTSVYINNKPHCYVIGPGLEPNNQLVYKILLKLIKNVNSPLILDAGAFNYLSCKKITRELSKRHQRGCETILTPHYGEAKKIAHYINICKSKKILNKIPFAHLAQSIVDATKSTIMLKSYNTYISNSDKLYVMKNGTPALAKAGSGDVLAGILGSIVSSNKLEAFDSCVLASLIHAYSGRESEKCIPQLCVTVDDIIENIPKAINYIVS